MSKICPITKEKVLYLDCLECEEKICKKNNKSKEFKCHEEKIRCKQRRNKGCNKGE